MIKIFKTMLLMFDKWLSYWYLCLSDLVINDEVIIDVYVNDYVIIDMVIND